MLCGVEKHGAPAAGLLVLNKKNKVFSILRIIAHIPKQNKTKEIVFQFMPDLGSWTADT